MSSRADLLRSAQWLWVSYHDYAGVARGKAVPRHRFEEVMRSGITFAKANWDFALNDHQIAEPLFAADSGDFRVVPDADALMALPGELGVVHALSWLYDGNDMWDGDPRGRLAAQVAELRSSGFAARISFESEFVLLHRDENGTWAPASSGPMFTTDDLKARWPVFEGALSLIEASGIQVHQFAKEYGAAQFEISLMPLPPIQAADAFLMARQFLKWAARDAGYVASFMPKPSTHLPGNGLHVHLSLWDQHGREVIGAEDDRERLSDIGSWGVGGLLAHAPALTALGAATPNSYRRLFPGSWAPAHIAWGVGNRAALVRVPGTGTARRFEYRLGDSSCNPYLYLTGILSALADGLKKKTTPPKPVAEDIGRWSDDTAAANQVARLPGTLSAALDALDADIVVRTALGPVISEHYPAVKRFEQASYEKAGAARGDSISDFESATYLEAI